MKAINAVAVGQSESSQVTCLDSGRPARNEREARKWIERRQRVKPAHLRRVAGGTPAVPASHLTALGLAAVFVVLSLYSANGVLAQRQNNKVALPSASSLVITTEPNAIIWIDEIRRGVTDPAGRIELKTSAGRHTLRVRA